MEGPNRFIFAINRTIDMIAIRPLAVTYRDWMPERGQKGVRNVLDNLGEPVTAINEGRPGLARPRRHHGRPLPDQFDHRHRRHLRRRLDLRHGQEQGRYGQDHRLLRRRRRRAREWRLLYSAAGDRPVQRPRRRGPRHRRVDGPVLDRHLLDQPPGRLDRQRRPATAPPSSTPARAPCSRSTTSRRTASTTMPR